MQGRLTRAFGTNLQRIRLAQGPSEAELGRKAGVSERRIGLLQRGEVSPRLKAVEELATALGVKIGELIASATRP